MAMQPSLAITALNHISRETTNVARLAGFYSKVMGFSSLERPDFGFGGAWLQIPKGPALHIIEKDASKPSSDTTSDDEQSIRQPELHCFLQSHHVALRTFDTEKAKRSLAMHGVQFATHAMPAMHVEQLFFQDPDGNVIEIQGTGMASASEAHAQDDLGHSNDSVPVLAIEHISRETQDIAQLRDFYMAVLGLPSVTHPLDDSTNFQTARVQLPDGVLIQFTESHPERAPTMRDHDCTDRGLVPQKYIRRSHHIALTVTSIEAAKQGLRDRGIEFHVNEVPGSKIVQLFFYDPDGNGIEIGNFDVGMSKL